jgi:hypothetical protein
MIDYTRVEHLARTPRTIDEQLTKIQAKPVFFLRGAIRQWEHDLMHAPLVFAYVVQANHVLYEPEGEWAPAVLLHTTDPRYARDARWLGSLAQRLPALKESGTSDPKANELGALLCAEESDFDLPVPVSVTGESRRASGFDSWTAPSFRVGASVRTT